MELLGIAIGIKKMLIFLGVLSVLIVVHEWGHFITAKKLGVNVQRFSLGFGPKLWSKVYNGTEFLICAIPLGGYVKMAGDEREKCKGTPDEFFSKSPGHRALIVLNGPVINFVLAYVLLVVVFLIGYPDLAPKVGLVLDEYPAQTAGLQIGDEIIQINSQKVAMWSEIQEAITTSKGSEIKLTIRREGQGILEKIIVPIIETDKNIFGEVQQRRIVGIHPAEETVEIRYGLLESFSLALDKLWEITYKTYKAIYRMVGGSMSFKENMRGPVGIFDVVIQAAELGVSTLFFVVAIISASLAIFNLLPIIPLDGGHLFLLGLEKIRGKGLSPKTDEIIMKIGFSLIMCLIVFVIYNDIDQLGGIDKLVMFWEDVSGKFMDMWQKSN